MRSLTFDSRHSKSISRIWIVIAVVVPLFYFLVNSCSEREKKNDTRYFAHDFCKKYWCLTLNFSVLCYINKHFIFGSGNGFFGLATNIIWTNNDPVHCRTILGTSPSYHINAAKKGNLACSLAPHRRRNDIDINKDIFLWYALYEMYRSM